MSGSIFTCGRRLGPGDFVHADADTDHGELWTDEGAQVILIVPPEEHLPPACWPDARPRHLARDDVRAARAAWSCSREQRAERVVDPRVGEGEAGAHRFRGHGVLSREQQRIGHLAEQQPQREARAPA